MNPVEQRKLDLWCRDMMSRPRWTYCEAVLWVAFRDLPTVRRQLEALRNINYSHGALGGAEIIETQVSDEQNPEACVELLPHTSLIVALKANEVQAWGRTRKHSGYSAAYLGDPEPISSAVWHEFMPVRSITAYPEKISPVEAGLELVPIHWRRTPGHAFDTPTKYWSAVQIDAASLRRAFAEPAGAKGDDPRERPDWWPSENVTLTHWARDGGAAEVAARQRLQAKGDAGPSEAAVCRELWRMWVEAGGGDADHPIDKRGKSIATLRAGLR